MDVDLRAANDEFYRAFAARDLGAMDRAWAQRTGVTCVHPGRDVIHGRAEVMESFRAIFSNEASPTISCEVIEAFEGEGAAVIVGYERIEGHAVTLIATNVFARQDGEWRMTHHHAAPAAVAGVRASDRTLN